MSATEELFLNVSLPPAEPARRIAEALDMDLTTVAGKTYLGRDGIGGIAGRIAGEIYENIYSDINPEPDEHTIFDGFPVVWEIFRRGKEQSDYDLQRAAARAVFDAVIATPRWPAILTHDLQIAVAAGDPEHGLREFPPRSSVDLPALAGPT